MTDLRDQLREYFDEVDPPFETASLMREPRPELAPTRNGVRGGTLIAVAAAVVVVLVVGVPLLLSGGQPDPAVEPPLTTVPPVTTTPGTTPTVTTVRENTPDLRSCLPLDLAGWSRSEPLAAMQADPRLPDAALTAAGGTAVAVGMDRDRNVEAYWSEDGVTWAAAEGFPVAPAVGESPPAVAGGPAGFVAVVVPDIYPGVAPLDHPPTPPILAFSEDGITWDQLDPETVPHGVLWLSDVYAGPAGFLITGTITTDRTSSGYGAFVWASPDGRSWSVADYPIDSWGYPTVVATDTGWAAHTLSGSLQKPTEIWRSADGANWYEVPTQNAPPDGVLAAEFRASPTAVAGSTWVIAPSLQPSSGQRPDLQQLGAPTVWTSTDDGATWDEYPIDSDQAALEHFTWDTAATSFGFLMTGRYDYGLEGSNLLHYSTDGTHWQTCATPRSRGGTAANFTEIALLEDTLVILESETGVLHTWKRPKRIEDERP